MIILKKGTPIKLYHYTSGRNGTFFINAEHDVEYGNKDSLYTAHEYYQVTFYAPFPTYNGNIINSISWARTI